MFNFINTSLQFDAGGAGYAELKDLKTETPDGMSYLGTLTPPPSNVDSPESNVAMYSPISSLLSPPQERRYDYQYGNVSPPDGLPYIKVLEEPIERFRFRYKSEMSGTHGCLIGNSSDRHRKSTFPTVKLVNYDRPAIIRCSLYQVLPDGRPPQPHPHRLVVKNGQEEVDDPHEIIVDADRSFVATFSGMGIIHTARKNLAQELFKKQKKLCMEDLMRKGKRLTLTQMEEVQLKKMSESENKSIDLNKVCLYFEAFYHDEKGIRRHICPPVFSKTISNLKSALTGELKICRMDRMTSSCLGGQEVFFLVEKVSKKNIKVRFYEHDEYGDNEIWEAYGQFTELDVHHQYAIVFKTPPYRDPNIDKVVDVLVELVRPGDDARSEPHIFKYKPSERVGRKRPKYDSFSSGELPTVLNISGESISFNANSEEVDRAIFELFQKSDMYEPYLGTFESSAFSMNPNLVTDSPSQAPYGATHKSSSQNDPTEMLAKRVVSEVANFIHSKPSPGRVKSLVNNLFVNLRTDKGDCALHTAIQCEQMSFLKYIMILLTNEQCKGIINLQNNDLETPLHYAVMYGNAQIVHHLIQIGGDPNIANNKGDTPLHYALRKSNTTDLVKELVVASDVNKMNDKGETPLQLAIRFNNLKALEMLVNANADVNLRNPTDGGTPLHVSVRYNRLEIVKFLLENSNVRLDETNFCERTPLQEARSLMEDNNLPSKYMYDLIRKYQPDAVDFEDMDIKSEPEDDDELPIKTEIMDIDEFPKLSEDELNQLAMVLDKNKCIMELADRLQYPHVQILQQADSPAKMLLNFASLSSISIYMIRKHISEISEMEEVLEVIDRILNKYC